MNYKIIFISTLGALVPGQTVYILLKTLVMVGQNKGILVVCDFALVFALAPISPLFCHFLALALALYFTLRR